MERARRGRPANPATEPLALTALQATILAQAQASGVPVDPAAVDRVTAALAKFSAKDIKAVEVLAESPLALEAMARLAVENPDAFLRHYATFLEFSKPKLARIEHTGKALGNVFVAVEQREMEPPIRLAGKVVAEQ